MTSILTGATEGPASSMEKHQPSPQMALPSSRGLINSDRDAGKGDVAELHSRHDPSSRLRTVQSLHHALKALRGLPDGPDVVVKAQPILQRGLKTEEEGESK